MTGEIISEVELSSWRFKDIYNAVGGGNATARIDAPTTTEKNFLDWGSALWAVKDGVIVNGALIGKIQRRANSRVLTIPLLGFMEYFQHRFLRSNQGMSYATHVDRLIKWDKVEQFCVFSDLINHAQSYTDGNIGVNVTWDTVSDVLVTSSRYDYTYKRVAVAIQELVEREPGFQYRYVYGESGNKPIVNFHLTYPSHQQSQEALIFVPEETRVETINVINALEVDGVSGNYSDTDNVTSIVGDFEIIAKIEADDYTPASIQTITSKWLETGDQRSWRLQLLTDGKLRFEWSEDGIAVLQEDSDSAITATDGEEITVKVTLDVFDPGTFSYKVSFFESVDHGVTWTAISSDPFEETFSVLF